MAEKIEYRKPDGTIVSWTPAEFLDNHPIWGECAAALDPFNPEETRTVSANLHLTLQAIHNTAIENDAVYSLGYVGNEEYAYQVMVSTRLGFLDIRKNNINNINDDPAPLCRIFFQPNDVHRYSVHRPNNLAPDSRLFRFVQSNETKNQGVTPTEMALLQLLSGQLQRMHRERKQ